MSSNTKWLPLYVADYLGDTMHLTTLQHGAYVLLLMHYWRNGPLPSDNGQLAAIVKLDPKEFRQVWAVLQAFFTANGDGTLHQKRMDWELRRWDEISDKRRAAGKRGAEAKYRSHPPASNGGPVTSPPPEPPKPQPEVGYSNAYRAPSGTNRASKPLANAKQLPVDNLANATRLPQPLPPVRHPETGNCQDFATTFASVHLHPQLGTLSYLGEEMRARAHGEPRCEENLPQPPPDHLRILLEEGLRQAEASDGKRHERRSSHTPDVQIAKVAKPRSMACHLSGPHLAMVRKQAGIPGAA
jgi:uncharacterized protein YdaU (DUF1376 family)